MKNFIPFIVLCLSMSACTTVKRERLAYLDSKSVPSLKLPAGLSDHKVNEYYVVPPAIKGRPTPNVVIMPPPDSLAAKHAAASQPKAAPVVKVAPLQHPNVTLHRPLLNVWSSFVEGLPDVGYNILRQDNQGHVLYFTTQPGDDAKLYTLQLKAKGAKRTELWLQSGGRALPARETDPMLARLHEVLG